MLVNDGNFAAKCVRDLKKKKQKGKLTFIISSKFSATATLAMEM